MNNKFIFFVLLLIIFTIGLSIAENEAEEFTEVISGPSYIEVEENIFVADFVAINKGVEYVLYHDDFLNKDIVYLDVFGGIGSNFLMEPGITYEISVNRDFALRI